VLAIAPEVPKTVVITDRLEAPEAVEVTDDAVAANALVAELALAVELPDALHFLALQAAIKPVGLALEAVFHAVVPTLITAVIMTVITPVVTTVVTPIWARFLALVVPLGDALGQGAAGSAAQQGAG